MSNETAAVLEPLEGFRATRGRTLDLFGGLDQEQVDFRPGPGRWSVGEVLDHLRLSEELYRGEVERLVELALAGKPPLVRRTLREVDVSIGPIPPSLLALLELPMSLATLFVPWPIRERLILSRWLPAKNPRVAAPRPGRPLAELVAELERGFLATAELFERHRDLDFRRMFHQHPLMGVLTPLQILLFLAAHERRHQLQASEVLTERACPARRR